MAPKKRKYSDSDGDSAHWETAREKEKAMKAPRKSGIYVQPSKTKRITPTDSNSSAKYTGKGKTKKKVVTTKR